MRDEIARMRNEQEVVARARERLAPALYAELRAWLLAHDPDAPEMLQWASRETAPPESPEDMAGEVIWIILCAGRRAQAARTIEKRVWQALRAGTPVMEAFGHRPRAAAIERAWRERERDFAALQAVLQAGSGLLDWCGSLPQVGETTKYQLAKNFGADVCKPDIWLCRLAGIADRERSNPELRYAACTAMCEVLARHSGDCVAVVDTLLWLACNKGVLVVSPYAGPPRFNPQPSAQRSMLTAA